MSTARTRFAAGQQPIRALFVWDGGLGIWGAVALGALGAWIGCRRRGISLSAFADAIVQLLSDDRLRTCMREAGLQKAEQYAWPVVVTHLLDHFAEVLAGKCSVSR